jgi:serine/threonine-protein kinase HipA
MIAWVCYWYAAKTVSAQLASMPQSPQMNNKCLYCYRSLNENEDDFHNHCLTVFFGTPKLPSFNYSLSDMTALAKNVVERHISVPGVQPKLSLSLVQETMNSQRLTVVGALGGNYIFKPPSEHYPEMPENEHLTMRMAEAFEIPTVDSSLIRLKSGELSYITRRIDRTKAGEKIHMLDMFQITGAIDKYKSSMEKIAAALQSYSDNTGLDSLRFFELALFSFLTGNNDMHLKNFSMITRENKWFLAPAYDLFNATIANPDDKEELALTLEARKSKFTLNNFEALGQRLNLNARQIRNTLDRFFEKQPIAKLWITQSFMSKDYQEKYILLLNSRYKRIFN